jgi:nucleoside-diphosphate-sugar epimerase
MQSVMVTGHLGYIGSELTRELLTRGFRVTGVDSGLFEASGDSARVEAPSGHSASALCMDIRDLDKAALRGVDVVFHTAGVSSHAVANRYPESTMDINGAAAGRLARLARDAGVSLFVLLSTASLYEGNRGAWGDEDSGFTPMSRYSLSKLAAEQAVLAASTDSFTSVALRLPTLYGWSPSLRLDLVVNKVLHEALAGQPLQMNDGGVQYRPLACIQDVTKFLVTMLSRDLKALPGRTLNVSSECVNVTVSEVFTAVQRVFPEVEIRHGSTDDPVSISYRMKSNRGAEWISQADFPTTLDEGIARLMDHFLHSPLSPVQIRKGDRCRWFDEQIREGRVDPTLRKVQTDRPGEGV